MDGRPGSAEPEDRYSLTGPEAARAVAGGLASAEWYRAPIPRAEMKALMQRSDGPALRDTALWLLLLAASGGLAYASWGTCGPSRPSPSTASSSPPAAIPASMNASTAPPSAPSG